MRQPELQDVVGWHALAGLHGMKAEMRFNETRHDVSTAQRGLPSSVERRPVFGIDGEQWRADTVDAGDTVVLDDQIHRASRGCAGAVDQVDAAEYQALVRSFALVTAGNVVGASLRITNRRQQQRQKR